MDTAPIFPFRDKQVGVTTDSLHFKHIDISKEVLIPLPPHPGAFGVVRAKHVHEGIDLYCHQSEPVFAIEEGVVVAVLPFTGEHAGSPWWNNTFAVLVEGERGVINYGELNPRDDLYVGSRVYPHDQLGTILTVLKQDKGRPRTMLHVELYEHGTVEAIEWCLEIPKPPELRDPTPLLRSAVPW